MTLTRLCLQLLDVMTRELEELRLFKLSTEQGVRSPDAELTRSQRRELDALVTTLKEVSCPPSRACARQTLS